MVPTEEYVTVCWGKIGAAAVVSVLAVSNVAQAAEIVFSTPGADRDLRRALASSSLLVQARNDKTGRPVCFRFMFAAGLCQKSANRNAP